MKMPGSRSPRCSSVFLSFARCFTIAGLALLSPSGNAAAQAPNAPPAQIQVPDWALPGSPTHQQVPPPAGFHRDTVTFNQPIGMFDGQSDIGGPLVPGAATFDPASKRYTIRSAGYNIWYQRDEFRFLWKKMSGDAWLAADATFPDPNGYGDRKVVLVIRQSLDDDAKEAMIGEHGTGMTHLAWRETRGAQMKDMSYRFGGELTGVHPRRIAIEKKGDQIAIYISMVGEPLHQFGPPTTLHLDGPYYIGIGFCSHQPDTVDTGVVGNVVLQESQPRPE